MARAVRATDSMMTIPEVCEITRSSRSTIKILLASGELPSFKISDGRTSPRYVWRSELEAFLARRQEAARAALRPSRGRRSRPKPKASAAAS